ncbi:MAG: MFS family permease [Halocynthiibacter sp.]|jgi:MFS family permease
MSLFQAAKASRAPMTALTCVGIFWGTLAAVLPALKQGIEAQDGAFGLALVMAAIGGMIAMFILPKVGRILGRHSLPLLSIGLIIAFFLPALPNTVFGFGAALLFTGLAMSILDISANVRISVLEERHGLHLMNANHAMFSFGFAGAAFAAGMARQAGFSPGQILPVAALVVMALIPLVREKEADFVESDDAKEEAPKSTPWRLILLTGGMLFCAFIGENATEAWSALHIERTLGGAPGEGGLGPMMLGLTMGFGRLAGQMIANRLGEARLIFFSGILGAFGALITAAAPSKAIVLIGVAIIGLGMAVIVPSASSMLGKAVHKDQRSFAISRAWMVGMTGFFVGPAMIGLISQLVGLRGAFVAVALIVALIVPAIKALEKHSAS